MLANAVFALSSSLPALTCARSPAGQPTILWFLGLSRECAHTAATAAERRCYRHHLVHDDEPEEKPRKRWKSKHTRGRALAGRGFDPPKLWRAKQEALKRAKAEREAFLASKDAPKP